MLIAKKTTLLEVAGSLLLLSLALLALCLLQSDTHSVRTFCACLQVKRLMRKETLIHEKGVVPILRVFGELRNLFAAFFDFDRDAVCARQAVLLMPR